MNFKDWFSKNYYVTTPRDPDPLFRPRRYRQSKELVLEAARTVIEKLPGWKVEKFHENQGRLQVGKAGSLLGLGEAIDLYAVQGLDGATTLEISSRSKAGKTDFGQNKRNLRRFLEAMDRVMPMEEK